MWPPERRQCDECGRSYQPKASRQRYCSRQCNDRHKYRQRCRPHPPIPCQFCGNGFTPINGHTRYCSDSCRGKSTYQAIRQDPDAWERAKAKARARYVPRPKPEARYCDVPGCGRKHLAKGLCKSHYYADRRAQGKDGRAPTILLRGITWRYGAWAPQEKAITCRVTVGVMAACPNCRTWMGAVSDGRRCCGACGTEVLLNKEEVEWVIYEAHSTEPQKLTAN